MIYILYPSDWSAAVASFRITNFYPGKEVFHARNLPRPWTHRCRYFWWERSLNLITECTIGRYLCVIFLLFMIVPGESTQILFNDRYRSLHNRESNRLVVLLHRMHSWQYRLRGCARCAVEFPGDFLVHFTLAQVPNLKTSPQWTSYLWNLISMREKSISEETTTHPSWRSTGFQVVLFVPLQKFQVCHSNWPCRVMESRCGCFFLL